MKATGVHTNTDFIQQYTAVFELPIKSHISEVFELKIMGHALVINRTEMQPSAINMFKACLTKVNSSRGILDSSPQMWSRSE